MTVMATSSAYLRNGNTSAGKPLAMDALSYHYNKDGNGNLLNNRLRHVTDGVTANSNYTEDIDGQVTDNYHYDQIGNLTGDTQEQIDSIEWNVYGKISRIWKNVNAATGALQQIAYRYDPSGNRISKTVYSNQDASNYKAVHTWYVRDASGNVMATYTSEDVAAKSTLATGTLGKLYLNELHMYGSSRLGIWSRKVDMDVVPTSGGTAPLLGTTGIDTFNRGNKFFELANHLGNVLVTVSDRKVGQNPVNGLYSSYTAEVISASDYAPFGMQMVGRTFSAGSYRYGFNGQEKSQEVTSGNYTAEYWEYDSRIGRRWNVDPVVKPYESSFASFANNPIWFGDKYGADTTLNLPDGTGKVTLPTGASVETYQSSDNFVKGTNIKTGAQQGSLRAFSYNKTRYSARWVLNDGVAEFAGYQDDNGRTFTDWIGISGDDGLSDIERVWQAIKIFNPFTEFEAYTSIQGKASIQKEGDMLKAVMPIGIQGTYTASQGFDTRYISPLDTYFNVGVKNYWIDLRTMPGQADFQSGDIANARALITIPYLSRGPFKTQLDVVTKDITKLFTNNLTIGSRGVIESPIDIRVPFKNTSLSVELNFGLRFKVEPLAFKKRL